MHYWQGVGEYGAGLVAAKLLAPRKERQESGSQAQEGTVQSSLCRPRTQPSPGGPVEWSHWDRCPALVLSPHSLSLLPDLSQAEARGMGTLDVVPAGQPRGREQGGEGMWSRWTWTKKVTLCLATHESGITEIDKTSWNIANVRPKDTLKLWHVRTTTAFSFTERPCSLKPQAVENSAVCSCSSKRQYPTSGWKSLWYREAASISTPAVKFQMKES